MTEPYAYEVTHENEEQELVYAGWLEKYATDEYRAAPRIPLYKEPPASMADAEPVAWLTYDAATSDPLITTACLSELASIPLYTAPPPASTNSLTDRQIEWIFAHTVETGVQTGTPLVIAFARAIIAATEAK